MPDCTCNNFPASLGNVTFGARVAIGASAPVAHLHVEEPASQGPAEIVVIAKENHRADLVFKSLNIWRGGIGWDAASQRIRVGYGDDASLFSGIAIDTLGNVGIGTTAPGARLEVSTDSPLDSARVRDASYPGIRLLSDHTHAAARNWLMGVGSQAYGDLEFKVSNAKGGDPQAAGSLVLIVKSDGKVGIGTPAPGERLEVDGSVKAAGHVEAAQNKRVKVGDANLSSGSSPTFHWAHLGVNVWFDGANWQTDDPNRVKGLIQLSNGELSFFVSNTGTPVTWTRRFRVSEQGDVYVNEVRAIRPDGIANKAYYAEPE